MPNKKKNEFSVTCSFMILRVPKSLSQMTDPSRANGPIPVAGEGFADGDAGARSVLRPPDAWPVFGGEVGPLPGGPEIGVAEIDVRAAGIRSLRRAALGSG